MVDVVRDTDTFEIDDILAYGYKVHERLQEVKLVVFQLKLVQTTRIQCLWKIRVKTMPQIIVFDDICKIDLPQRSCDLFEPQMPCGYKQVYSLFSVYDAE